MVRRVRTSRYTEKPAADYGWACLIFRRLGELGALGLRRLGGGRRTGGLAGEHVLGLEVARGLVTDLVGHVVVADVGAGGSGGAGVGGGLLAHATLLSSGVDRAPTQVRTRRTPVR